MISHSTSPSAALSSHRPSSLLLMAPGRCRPSSLLFGLSHSSSFADGVLDAADDQDQFMVKRSASQIGGFFTFQKQYPELCESSTQVRKSGALSTSDHPQSALTVLPPSTCRPQTASLRLNSASINFASNGSMNSNQKSSAEDSALMRRQFALAEGPRTAQIENEQLLGAAQQANTKVNFRAPACPVTAPPALKMPCSWSQPCLRGLTHFMFLGSQNDALNPSLLQSYGITKVINLSETCPRPEGLPDDANHFLRIPIKDSYCAKLLPHFDQAFKFIENARRSEEKVLLHCLAGISRSATLAIAYIMRSQRLSSEEAYKFVKTRRQSISPNFNFMGQLMEYEKQLREQHILPPACSRPHSYTPGTSATPSQDESENNETSEMSNEPPSRPTSFACAPINCSVTMPMCRLSKSASSDFVHSLRDSFVNENGKRTSPLAGFPERPRQLMKKADRRSTLDPNGSSQTLKSVLEEVPSPSTEFSKLDISIANPCFGINTSSVALSSESTKTSCEPPTPAPAMSLENPFFMAPAAHRAGPPVPPRPEKKNSNCSQNAITKSQSEVPKIAPVETHSKHTSSLLRCVFRKGRALPVKPNNQVKIPMIPSVATASTSVHHCHLPFKLKNCKGLRRFRKGLRQHHSGIEANNVQNFDVLPTVPEPSETNKDSDSIEDDEQYFSVDEDENSQSEVHRGSPTNNEQHSSINKRRSLSNQILFFKNSSRRNASQSSSTHDDSPESGFVDDYYEHRSQSGGSLAGSSSCPQGLSQHSLDTTSSSVGESEPTCALTDPERASLSSTSSLEIAVQ
ncbi:dual specificity phosphatase, catalytic domain-containing protein [Ditylenchus destructor]|nr:dual specificity phosphatase, catalytic domain-containing protein [Ditylenchus destructor]